MNKKEAETLLKYGAYDFFKEEREGRTEELSNAFCEADIDQILEKNAKVITIDSQGGSSFAKASFITDTSDEIDINDPNFWTKVVGLKEQQQEEMGPRVRRKVEYQVGDVEESGQEAFFDDDDGDWSKTDRDMLMKLVGSDNTKGDDDDDDDDGGGGGGDDGDNGDDDDDDGDDDDGDVIVVGIRLGILGAYLHKRTNAEISKYFNSISECMHDWTACSDCLGK